MKAALLVRSDPAAYGRWQVDGDENNEGRIAHSAFENARFGAAANVDQVQQPQRD